MRPRDRERYLARMTPFDPLAWVRASRSRFLFQHMRSDPNFRPAELTQLSAAARSKRVEWYRTDTELEAPAVRARAAFLRAALG